MYRDGGKATAAGGNEGSSSAIVVELDEGRPKEAIWQMNIREGETWESGPYPERPGEPDCAYYIRTGLCRFGMTCKYNHPPNTKLAVAAARLKGNYPEQAGQPECQYYMRTGTCKFGATCKFHHPRDKAGSAARVQSNILGYPLRPNEKECAYYLRTGICKFGNTCKFHHPQPYGTIISPRASPVYPPVHSSTAHGQQSYAGGLTNWPMPRPSFVPNPRWQGPSNYAQVIVPQGMVQVSAWSPYSGQFTSVSSSGNQQQTQLTSQFYKTSRQNESTVVTRGTFSSFRSGAIPVGHYTMQTDSVFPERPDQPECQFYMKTGDCKFGAVCKFHHPRERLIPTPNCVLSPLGLPLRPGEASCVFYSRYGVCKFGPSCKFDHPIANFTYSTVASASDIPVVQGFVGSSSGPPALTLSSNADENIVAEGAHATSSIGQVASFIQSFAEKNKK